MDELQYLKYSMILDTLLEKGDSVSIKFRIIPRITKSVWVVRVMLVANNSNSLTRAVMFRDSIEMIQDAYNLGGRSIDTNQLNISEFKTDSIFFGVEFSSTKQANYYINMVHDIFMVDQDYYEED